MGVRDTKFSRRATSTQPARRRFLRIGAAVAGLAAGGMGGAMLLGGGGASVSRWRGVALGAEAEITIAGLEPRAAQQALAGARDTIRRVEALFSLYDPTSALSRLNRRGVLAAAPPAFAALMEEVDRIHRISGGAFDPTVQPLWRLLAESRGDPPADALTRARTLIGWDKVFWDATAVRFAVPGMALTLNGIAQGFATDRVRAILAAHGLPRALVNIGEFGALGGPWRIGIAGADGALSAEATLHGGALATSNARALLFGGVDSGGHILDPSRGAPRSPQGWASVTVEADTATHADALSTALIAAPRDAAGAIVRASDVRRVWAFTADGTMHRLGEGGGARERT